MKKKITRRIVFIGIVVLLLTVLAIWYMRKTVPPEMHFQAATLTTLDDNKIVRINDFVGSVVIVSCFQTWCRDCARETPILNNLATTFTNAQFKVVYITDEISAKLAAFRQRLPSDNILFTITSKKLADFGVHVYPTTFLLNKRGKVIITKLEGYDWQLEEGRIRKLLNE